MPESLRTPSTNQIRLELQDLILLGPTGGEEEIIDEGYVHDHYILGMLIPHGQSVHSPMEMVKKAR